MFKASCCLFWASKKPGMAITNQWTSRVLFLINVLAKVLLQKHRVSAAVVLCVNTISESACCF